MPAPTGQDVTVEFTVSGAIVGVADQITNFEENEELTDVDVKPLGRSGTKQDQEFDGHSGSFESATETGAVADYQDAIAAARELRVPLVININVKTRYRNGQVRSYVYPDVKLKFSRTIRRGEAVMDKVSWRTGKARIPV